MTHALVSGATELPSAAVSDSTGPLFLSSLHCSEGDESLLDDCSHDRVGLASCDDTSGLAVGRCFGKEITYTPALHVYILDYHTAVSITYHYFLIHHRY